MMNNNQLNEHNVEESCSGKQKAHTEQQPIPPLKEHNLVLDNPASASASCSTPLHSNMPSDPEWLNRFIHVYQQLSSENLDLLETIYDQQITFIDPIHHINGLDNLHRYFAGMYKNLSSCHFKISNVIAQPNQAAIYWQMTYQHSKLNKGKVVSVFGSSHLCAKQGKITYHRDYLDLGAMLYEQLPLFGRIISWIKNRAGQ